MVRYDPEEQADRDLNDIFNFRDGASLRPTGYLPSFVDSLVEKQLLELEFLYGKEPAAADAPGELRGLPRRIDGETKLDERASPSAYGNRTVMSDALIWPACLSMGWPSPRRRCFGRDYFARAWTSSSATWPRSSAGCGFRPARCAAT